MLKIIVRSAIIYITLMLGLRLMGKRQMGELELNELVIAMLLSDMASTPLQDPELPLSYGLVAVFTVLVLCFLLSYITLKSFRFRKLFCGEPTLIIREGKLQQSAMRRNRFTIDELVGELRVQGITDLTAVKYAILETSGQLSIVERTEEKPLTPKQMGLQVKDESELPILLINDGVLLTRNLEKAELSDAWLQQLLSQHGASSVRQVFYLSVDAEKKPLLIKKDRFISPRGSS